MFLRSGNQKVSSGATSPVWKTLLPKLVPLAVPVFAALSYWGQGMLLLLLTAIATPLLFMLLNPDAPDSPGTSGDDRLTGLVSRPEFETRLGKTLARVKTNGTNAACLMLQLDDFHEVAERYGEVASEQTFRGIASRLVLALRDSDTVTRIGANRFAVAINDVRHLDLEVCIQLARRLQSAIEEPVQIGDMNVYVSCCVGFRISNSAAGHSAATVMSHSTIALDEALRHAPSAIRAYSEEMEHKAHTRQELMTEAGSALGKGQLRPWFQPQVSTDTGQITGFEALVRWEHPTRGVISPNDFLDALEKAGQLERLGDLMLDQALLAQKTWDDAGFNVPHVGVNFAKDELRNPNLVEKVAWKLDQYGISPNRLAVEVLENVVSESPEDVVARNINGLAALGCRIDLDDFGTGHASISSIRRFTVSRLKIDRSFVMHSDRDPEQQRLIHAIITMAERLGLETLAEGVESAGEHTILAQLGCDHVQGFGIARPMPFADTVSWMRKHNSKLQNPPEIGRKTG